MGGELSKLQANKETTLQDNVKLLDYIATETILGLTLKDMNLLHNEDYCNKLLILTSDVIKKYIKTEFVTYIHDGKVKTNKMMYTNKTPDFIKSIDSKKFRTSKCKGIAKFYIKIANLFSAIALTVDPIFSWIDDKGRHKYSISSIHDPDSKTKLPPKGKYNILINTNDFCTLTTPYYYNCE